MPSKASCISVKSIVAYMLSVTACSSTAFAGQDELEELKELVSGRKFKQAQAMALSLRDQHENDSDYYTVLGELARLKGNQEEAIRLLEKALVLDKTNPEPAVMLADIYLRNLELDSSLTKAYLAVSIAPDYLPGRLKFIEILIETDQTGEAERQLKFVMETKAGTVEVQELLLSLSRKKKDWNTARKAIEFLIKERPADAYLKLELAAVLQDSGDLPAAQKCLGDVIGRYPELTQARVSLARIKEMHEHDFVKAAALYREVLAVDPENSEAAAGLERTARKQRDAAYRMKLFLRRHLSCCCSK